jgi:hypothetical protein
MVAAGYAVRRDRSPNREFDTDTTGRRLRAGPSHFNVGEPNEPTRVSG